MGAGRPTDYIHEDIMGKTRLYLKTYTANGDVIPTIEGLALHLDVTRDTIYEWASQEDKKEFSDILKKLRLTKSKELQNKGLNNTFNSGIAKLLLGHEGYRESLEADLTSKGEKLNNVSSEDIATIARGVSEQLKEKKLGQE